MNILFYLIRYPGIGGIERVTSLISNRMCEDGHNVSILSVMHQDVCAGNTQAKVYFMPDENDWLSPENFAYAEQVVRNGHYDVILYLDSYARIENIILRLSKKYNIPLYVFERSTPLYFFKMLKWKPFLSVDGIKQRLCFPKVLFLELSRKRKLFDSSVKYIVQSKNYIPEVAKLIFAYLSKTKFGFISNPIIYTPIIRDEFNQKENVIFTVCQIDSVKRIDLMLDYWKQIEHHDWKFFIGGDGSLKSKLQDRVKTENIKDVIFLGYIDPSEYYKKSRIFWMTSKFEGWPNTLLEAMQNGCVPIAYYTFSSLPDIIDDNKTGFIVKENDSKSFISITEKLMRDELLCNTIAINAIQIAERFDLNNIIKDWYNLLGCQNQTHRG